MKMGEQMVAQHAIWPRVNDQIFNISEKAQKAVKDFGKENVINATIGALMDDDGQLITLDTVFAEYKSLPNKEIAAYAPIVGSKEYLDAVEKACFRDFRPDAHIVSVASPGGLGSIKLAVCNFTDEGDEILTSDWFWSPYVSIAEEVGRKIGTYQLFDENNDFNFASFKEKFIEISNKQDRILTILNTPAHNPTGYSVGDDEWDKIIDLSKKVAKNKDKKIVLFVDVAYIDFARDDIEARRFFEKFSNLPANILVIVGFSMSKGFTAYGMRMGACINITSDADVADQIHYTLMHSCRANWSNSNRAPMKLLANIMNDNDKFDAYIKEKDKYKDILVKRADAFVKASKECDLEILPYIDGFFISIPCKNAKQISDELTKDNIFVVALKKGLRFAVCSVDEKKCYNAPRYIKRAIDKINK